MPLGKHFINEVEDPVERGLKCVLRQDHSLRLIESEKVLYRQQSTPKVLLLSGGGSGHEPAHAGYLGEGMLDICVAGQIFASPSASQVLAGLRALESPCGTLMIVKNYTGDKLNFGLAAQKAKAEGIKVNAVFVGDDVSVKGNGLVGRRGLAGVVFVHKIAGALAARGATLDDVTRIAQNVADNIYTVGVSLDRCSVPRRGKQESLPFENLEYGMGIHNEPGVRRDNIKSLSTVVTNIMSLLLPSISETAPVAVMFNNLGGLSVLEFNVIAEEVICQLHKAGLDVRRMLVGTFVTSLDGPGFSVTLLNLQPGFEELINAGTTAPAWPKQIVPTGNVNDAPERAACTKVDNVSTLTDHPVLLPFDSLLLQEILGNIKEKVTEDEPQITKFDTLAGDGDCGETLLKGVKAVYERFSTTSNIGLIEIFQDIATTVERSMGGTSGAIYAIFFNALANSLSFSLSSCSPPISMTGLLTSSLSQSLEELCRYTTARKGHKTLMDALIPFVEVFSDTRDLKRAVEAANDGAEGTRKLDAVLGRASYVGKESFDREDGGVPDPGALGVVSILNGILRSTSVI